MPAYFQGLAIGLAYVAPIGMQNLFVINTALTQPRRRALLTALIVIFFDITLALFCFFGIGTVVERFTLLQLLLLLCGGIIVTRIGVGLIQEEPTLDQSVEVDLPLKDVAVKACVVTWFNPQAILDGTMIFGGFRAGGVAPGESLQLILGSSSASFLWFFGITLIISLFRAHIGAKLLRRGPHLLRHGPLPGRCGPGAADALGAVLNPLTDVFPYDIVKSEKVFFPVTFSAPGSI